MKPTGKLLIIGCLLTVFCNGQLLKPGKNRFTKADTLRGSITEFRKGWNVLYYNLKVDVNITNELLTGSNEITYEETLPVRRMQIDLQAPLLIDSIVSQNGQRLPVEHNDNVWLVRLRPDGAMIKFLPGIRKLTVYYHGIPKAAVRPPWDGGVVWENDDNGNPWVATACQKLGASVWWPCKDHQSDEPDNGMTISITAPDTLSAISNGRLKNVSSSNKGTKTWTWEVKNPINNYDVTMNIGRYVHFGDTLMGEAGRLDLDYWVMDYNIAKGKKQFTQVKPMIRCFEHWFDKYPFYEDSYKLVETPFLGMEHQSAVAYGNKYMNGYLGKDRSGSGWGLKWDYIIIHESGHEWFGNNITARDIADMWVHEGFTDFSETLYTEWIYGKNAGAEYCFGLRRNITNDKPVTGMYGVNNEGSTDMYYKGANMIQTIRNSINDDEKFRGMLRGLNNAFYHQMVTAAQVEDYISKQSGTDFSTVFKQYLKTTKIPVLEYYYSKDKKQLFYKWSSTVAGFSLPLVLKNENKSIKIHATDKWKILNENTGLFNPSSIEMNYYISVRQVK